MPRIRLLAIALLLALAACGGPARPAATVQPAAAPQPSAASSPAPATQPGATTQAVQGDVADTLKAQLQQDQVLVSSIRLTEGNPAVLAIDYQFDRRRYESTSLNIDVALSQESERNIHAISRRVAALVAAGIKIDRVDLRMDVDDRSGISWQIDAADMLAWASGTISDDDYRRIWNRQPGAYPYPSP
jgi:hypothetical protein